MREEHKTGGTRSWPPASPARRDSALSLSPRRGPPSHVAKPLGPEEAIRGQRAPGGTRSSKDPTQPPLAEGSPRGGGGVDGGQRVKRWAPPETSGKTLYGELGHKTPPAPHPSPPINLSTGLTHKVSEQQGPCGYLNICRWPPGAGGLVKTHFSGALSSAPRASVPFCLRSSS